MPQKRCITTEIEINAPSTVVWKVLTNFPGYGSWNPIIRQIEGKLIVGKRLSVFVRLPCGLPMLLWPKVLNFGIEQEIRWLGNLLVSGLLDGEHFFMLEHLGEAHVRFIQKEAYSGVLLPIMWLWLRSQGLKAFGMMNQALKAEAERLCESSSGKEQLPQRLCSLLSRSFVCECHHISSMPRFQLPPRIGELVHPIVSAQLRRIFDFRKQAIQRLLSSS